MNILVLGSGGREHAIAWALAKSPRCDALYVAPGNGGTADIAENVPGLDIMDAAALLAFVREVRFERLGVFPYSEEEGTWSAENLRDDIPETIKQQRAERVMALQNEISLENNRRRVGRTERVIIDSRQGDWYVGRTQYDSPEVDQEILIPASERRLLRGHFYDVTVTSAADYDLYGEIAAK